MLDRNILRALLKKYPAAIKPSGSGPIYVKCENENGILVLNYYLRDEKAPLEKDLLLKYTHFVAESDFKTFDHDKNEWKKSKITCSTPVIDKKDIAKAFEAGSVSFNGKAYDSDKNKLIDDIYSHEAAIQKKRLTMSQMKEAAAFEEFNSLIPPPDMAFFDWAKNEVLPSYIIYNNKEHNAKCTFCGHEFVLKNTEKLKRNMIKECPNCHKKCKSLPGGHYRIDDTRYAAYADRYGDGMIVRYFELYQSVNEKRSVFEYARDFYDRHGNISSYYFDSFKNCGYRGFLPEKEVRRRPYYITPPFKGWTAQAEFFFPSREYIKDSPYKYIFLSSEYDSPALGELVKSNVYNYIYKSMKFPVLEALIKCGYFNIARLILENECNGRDLAPYIKVNKREASPVKALGLPKHVLKRLKSAGLITTNMFYEIQRLLRRDRSIDESVLEFILKYNPRSKETDLIMGMGKCLKTLNYINRQSELNNIIALRDYYDYLVTLRRLNMPLASERRFPQNLMAAHDEVMAMYKAEETRNKAQRYEKLYEELKSFYPTKTIQGLTFILPKSIPELTHEGEAQHNCVGRIYLTRILDRESVVLFVRKSDSPLVPYITLELNPVTKSIVQCRYKYNKPCGEDITAIVNKYVEIIRAIRQSRLAA